MLKKIITLACVLIFQHYYGQNINRSSTSISNYAEKGQQWLDLNLGLSFFSSNQTTLDELSPVLTEKPNYFGLLVQPKYQYFLLDNLSIGAHLGFGYEELYENDLNFNQINRVYFTGLQSEYFFLNLGQLFFLSAEMDAGVHFLNRDHDTSEWYFEGGLSFITSFLVKDELVLFMKLSDIISYASSEDNFFNLDQGFSVNNTFRNFINFPQFGIRYRLF